MSNEREHEHQWGEYTVEGCKQVTLDLSDDDESPLCEHGYPRGCGCPERCNELFD